MTEFLLISAVSVLLAVAIGLLRVFSGEGDAKRLMAAQLLGSGGGAALLLFGTATGAGGAVDVALVLALLAAFAAIAFVKKGSTRELPGVAETEK